MLPPVQYLSKIKPFSFLSEAEITELVSWMDIALYRKGKIIFEANEKIKKFYFVREGKVGLFCGSELIWTVEKDEIIEMDAHLSSVTSEYTAKALEDSVLFEFDLPPIKKALQENSNFKRFIENLISGKLASLIKLNNIQESTNVYERPINMILERSPLSCFKNQSLKEAIKLMSTNNVGSVVIVDPENRPIGIITHSDILRSIEIETPLTEPVGRVMSYPVQTINSGASVLDAYFKFLSNGVNHLVVVDDEKLVGVVSIKDVIYYFEPRGYFIKITKDIIRSNNLGEIKKFSHQINSMVKHTFEHGFSYSSISRLVTIIIDTILRRVLSMLEDHSKLTIMLVGEYGRRELRLPVTIDLLIIGNKKYKGDVPNYAETFSDLGIKIENVEFCFDDIHQFLNSLPLSKFLKVLDARYIFGDPIAYIKFKDALRELIRQKVVITKFKSLIDIEANEIEEMLFTLSNGIKVASYLYGDTVSRPTWERLNILESCGAITKELSQDLIETYLTLRTVELNSILNGNKELLDKIVYKRIIKAVSKYQLWMKKILP